MTRYLIMIAVHSKDETFSFSYIHMLAKKQMAAEGIVDQIPVYSGPRCSQPPFCVIPKDDRLLFG